MYQFVYNIPTKVYFGRDQLSHLSEELRRCGTRVLLTYGGGSIKRTGLYDRITEAVRGAGLTLFELSGIDPNPRIESVRRGAELCREKHIDVVLAVGGGSTIDCSKLIAAGALYDGDPWDFLTRKAAADKALPLVTVLTLAATGSEMDAGGVISNPETADKIGYAAPAMQPRVSFLDPSLTYTVSARQTACGSADILSHAIETYFNETGSMYLLDSFLEGIMRTVVRYAPIALRDPENEEARANLMWASSWAINGFARACQSCGWSCHPMEHQLSAVYDITHGLGLAILTPRWMERVLDEGSVQRFRDFAVRVFDVDGSLPAGAAAREGIDRLSAFLFDTLGLERTLTEIGIDDSRFSAMAEKACGGKVIAGYRALTPADVEEIYRSCL